MTSIDGIVAQLNDYEASHDAAEVSGPRVHNIWQDVILPLPEYDEERSDVYDTGQNDRFVVRVEGTYDHCLIRFDEQAGKWFDSMVLR